MLFIAVGVAVALIAADLLEVRSVKRDSRS